MQTVLATVGTSLLTNKDIGLDEKRRRPWVSADSCGDIQQAVAWMRTADIERISAETNTLWRLDLKPEDRVILLHSDTTAGCECAVILQAYLDGALGQRAELVALPGIHYEMAEQAPALVELAKLLVRLVEGATGYVTFAATGGFKAEVMQMAVVGNALGIPVCYVHEEFKGLIYLPAEQFGRAELTQRRRPVDAVDIPVSNRPRDEVAQFQERTAHHRPKGWEKVVRMVRDTPWVDAVRVDDRARSGIRNGVKEAPRGTPDGRHVFWLLLNDGKAPDLPLVVETTGFTPAHKEASAIILREILGQRF